MKSQVNALLQLLRGVHKDIIATYPELRGDLEKDIERITLLSQTRGLGLFGLDLPHLGAQLRLGLETGRLVLEGPLSKRVSKRIQVPRLYAGLWLRVFGYDSCLKPEVDVNALFFLIQVLNLGKSVEVPCSYDRVQATVGAYYDIESSLRKPTLKWEADDLGLQGGQSSHPPVVPTRDCSPYGCSLLYHDLLLGSPLNAEQPGVDHGGGGTRSSASGSDPMSLHLVQAMDGAFDYVSASLPLFHSPVDREENDARAERRKQDQKLLTRLQQVADLVVGNFDQFDPISYSTDLEGLGKGTGFKHGPGAVAERKKNWEKSLFVNWPHKLQATFPFELCGKTVGDDRTRPHNHEVASRLIKVPKTMKSPRLIAAESTAHQWCQQLVWRFLQDQCRKSFGTAFIDFKDQSKSSDMVLAASKDRSLATVDLSDASDRLSCWTVERMYRSNPSILTALHAARTRYIRDEISEYGSFLKLRKFASQGTATTFPVMSIVMLCIALASSLGEKSVTKANIRKLRDQVRVFGDDIILPTHGYEQLRRTMELLQLKVNTAKSYVNGQFRESCGVDGYLGYDVTPVKPSTVVASSPASCQAVVDTANNLFNKGLWNASTACFALLPGRVKRNIRIVGANDVGFGGATSYSGGDESHLRKRWNSRLHRTEVRVWGIVPHTEEHLRDGYPALLDFFAKKHSAYVARTVSEYAESRRVKADLRWEPANTDARLVTRSEGAFR